MQILKKILIVILILEARLILAKYKPKTNEELMNGWMDDESGWMIMACSCARMI